MPTAPDAVTNGTPDARTESLAESVALAIRHRDAYALANAAQYPVPIAFANAVLDAVANLDTDTDVDTYGALIAHCGPDAAVAIANHVAARIDARIGDTVRAHVRAWH